MTHYVDVQQDIPARGLHESKFLGPDPAQPGPNKKNIGPPRPAIKVKTLDQAKPG